MKQSFISRLALYSVFALFTGALSQGTEAQAQGRGSNSAPSEVYATASDGTILNWDVYAPEGVGPWPVVLVIHGGGFKGGSLSSPSMVECARDLASAGFLALVIDYRLAPNGSLPGQVSDGRYPDQSDDVRLAVIAARADARGNGQVGIVGGSAGGYFAAFMAATGTVGQDRIDVGVSLSGAYDFSDFSPDPNIAAFADNVTNYMGVTTADIAALQGASPAYLADAQTAPLFLIHTEGDPMPYSQVGDMTRKLDDAGVTNYQTLTLPGADHSFFYWPQVKDSSIAFLTSWFAGHAPPTASPTPSPTATPAGSPPPQPVTLPLPSKVLLNVSTRVNVQSGEGVMIGGFVISGDVAKKVTLRAIGPSLNNQGVTQTLADPVLELYNSSGKLVAQNDNCSALSPDRIPEGFKPADGRESIITTRLPKGSYTAVLRGANGSTGIALFELYDLDPANSRIVNISTRGEVGNDSDTMIGGFIIGGSDPTRVIVRAIGPSLAAVKISNPLADPYLELHDSNGSLIYANDNWRSSQTQQILDSGIAPTDDREAAIVATLPPGSYTALVRGGATDANGVALVEVYDLEP
ncbi:MAG: alpha/beta fold hydrolase [Chthoniobacterales bacterium]